MWMILECRDVRGRQLLTRRGRLCFSGSRFPELRVSSVIVRRRVPPLPSLVPLKKDLCYEKFQPHTKVKRTCNEARTPVPDIQLLSVASTVGSSVPLFLFLCWSISKKIADIMSSRLPVLQYALKKNLYVSFYFQNTVVMGAPQTGLPAWRR